MIFRQKIPAVIGIFDLTNNSGYVNASEFKLKPETEEAERKVLTAEELPILGKDGKLHDRSEIEKLSKLKALPKDDAEKRIEELLTMVELKNVRRKKLKTFSGGMLRRIGIAQTLLNNPEILVLDEPTAGLDPKERVRFRNIISSLGKDRIVLLSTHIVSDIEYIADRILIMKNGELIQEGTEAELTEKVKGHVWKCIVSEKEAECLGQRFVVSNMRSNGENIELRVISEKQPMREAELLEGTLEDAYLYETQSAEEK